MEARANEEYHDLLDYLAEQKYFGDVTLYFQGGKIERNRLNEVNTKSEIKERMQARKRRKAIPVPLHPGKGAFNG
jgi:hypothetical protein